MLRSNDESGSYSGMMGDMTSWMIVFGLLGLVLLIALIAVGVYLGVRLARPRVENDSGRALLDRRLADGEIDVEDYYERDAVFRARRR